MAHDDLFTPLKLGAIEAANRVFMAPLTRNRAHSNGVPKALAATYYAQRASAGLIISEASQISPMGKGYLDTPGIYSDEQVEAWKPIVDAVHEAGGKIAIQLWHVGRVSHSSLLPDNALPVAPSAISAEVKTFTANGFEAIPTPRALTTEEVAATVEDYAHAARQAMKAGFDLVEIHAANGYLIQQFLSSGTNTRSDQYGGPIENRTRFLREVVDAVTKAIGADRTGIRLSPTAAYQGISDDDPEALFEAVYDYLETKALAYLHVIEDQQGAPLVEDSAGIIARLRPRYSGVYVVNGGFDGASGAAAIREGRADAVAYGRPFISNPDLPARLQADAPLTPDNRKTWYGGGEEGYTDYPALETAE